MCADIACIGWSCRDLGLHDLQYLQQEHEARACLVIPLVVAESALGALSLAALQPDAFRG